MINTFQKPKQKLGPSHEAPSDPVILLYPNDQMSIAPPQHYYNQHRSKGIILKVLYKL